MAYRVHRRMDGIIPSPRRGRLIDTTLSHEQPQPQTKNFWSFAQNFSSAFLSVPSGREELGSLLSASARAARGLGSAVRDGSRIFAPAPCRRKISRKEKRNRLTASVLVFVMLFQTIAGVFAPVDLFNLNRNEAHAGWFGSDWGYRKEIKVDHTKVANTDQAYFPMLVSLTDPALKTVANGGKVQDPSGNLDIMFTSASGSSKLDHEIESYDANSGKLVAWVKIPTLSASVDTSIYMYYSNSSITSSQENKTGVWDDGGANNFKGIWHLGGNVSNGVAGHLDSTQYANNGTPNNFSGTATSTTNATGQIGGADMFDGTDDYVNIGLTNNINADFTDKATFSAWVNISANNPDTNSPNYGISSILCFKGQNTGIMSAFSKFRTRITTSVGGDVAINSSGTYSSGSFYYVVGTYNGSTMSIYIDGVNKGDIAQTGDISSASSSTIGMAPSSIRALNGSIDEVRVSNTARSADWIKTEYSNQSNPTEFYSLGIEEVSSPASLSSFGYRKAITIDHTNVAGSLTNFPVLINLPTDTSLQSHSQSTGNDILFTSSNIAWNAGTVNDKLASEIESYNSGNGNLTAWVKIPDLSSTTDTTIYMYYGNSGIANQQNKTAVWDVNTKMVQHMNQTGTGTVGDYKDSTAYQNNSTNATGQPTVGAGQIGNAESFDGTKYISHPSVHFEDAQPYTYSAWMKWGGTNPTDFVLPFGRYNETDNTIYFTLSLGGKNFGYRQNDAGSPTVINESDSTGLFDGKWHLVSWKAAADRNVTFYVDGVQNGNPTAIASTEMYYNAISYGYMSSTYMWNGLLDEVRISDTARSASWIATEHANQSNPTEFYSVGIEQVSSPASLSSFGYRKAITIDHTKVSGDLVNFPVLINLPTDASLQAHAQADNDDILFTSANVAWNTGTANDKLAHEVEGYNSATGSLQAWVKIPNLSSTTDTVIYMYYGNASVTSQQNKTAVWDSSTRMVQHMNQNPGGTAPQMIDSTQYANNGTSGGTMASANSAAGQVDGATSFDGTDDYLNAGNGGSLNLGTGAMSFDLWVNAGTQTEAYPALLDKSAGNDWTGTGVKLGFWLGNRVNMGDGYLLQIGDGTSTGSTSPDFARFGALNGAGWNHLVGTVDAVGGTPLIKAYRNGVLVESRSRTLTGSIDTTYNLNIGQWRAYSRNFAGSIDEVRISNTARSADWIKTEYNNQSNPTEFFSLGIEQVSNAASLSSFGYRKAITIDHTKVSGDLANFGVLINLPTDASLAGHAQADADDILFTASSIAWNTGTVNDKLASEIESYTSSNGSLQAWVKIPDLSSTTDTTIYMYYGNSGIANQQNKTAVWDVNTRMVQHMNQTGTGTVGDYKDSTAYQNNSVNTGISSQPTAAAAGQIGTAESFDGVDDLINFGSPASLNFNSTNSFTFQVWAKDVNTAIGSSSVAGLLVRDYNNGYGIDYYPYNNQVRAGTRDTVNGSRTVAYNPPDHLKTWNHIAFTYTPNDPQGIKMYDNGALKLTTSTVGFAYFVPNENITMGTGILGGGAVYLNGLLDEARISNTARSADWIKTEYNNQSNPTEFYSLGIEQVSSPASLSSFGYRKAITIDHTKVSADLVNFPVLINLPTDTSLAAHAQADGDDILFTSSSIAWNTGTVNDKLASEIEAYNSTTGSLTAWVKIPTLSSTTDTVIYIYYGNASVTSQQNKTAVWDVNTKMVQHMNQTGTGAAGDYNDSTAYANNSTNTTSQPTATMGQIGNAESFDGASQHVAVGGKESLFLKNSGTISTWIYPTALAPSGYNVIYTSEGSADVNKTPYLRLEGGVLRAYLGNGTTLQAINSSFRPALNQWHSVVLSWDGANAKIYMDNQTYTTSQTVTVQFTGAPYNISRYTTVAERTFQGSIDEVRISNTARSSQWIAAQYANQSSPSTFSALGGEQVYRLEITGSANQTAGNSQAITLTAKDVNGSVRSDFTGDKVVTFSGANAAPDGTLPTCTDKNNAAVAFGLPTTLAFVNGVATCNLRLYKAEAATVTAGGISSTAADLGVAVSPNLLTNFLVQAPASASSGTAFAATVTARDFYDNITRSVSGATALTVDAGSITPTSIASGSFTDDGVWSGNLTVAGITEQPSVAITATNGANSGAAHVSVLGIPQAPANASASRNSDYSMTLSWQDTSTVETGYRIERKMDDGSGFGAYRQIGSVGADVSSFTDDASSDPADAPVPDRRYEYRVRAYNGIGQSAAYAEDAVIHYTTPNAPSDVSGSYLSDKSFRVSYTDNAAVTDTHRIERCSNADCSGVFETQLGTFTSSPQTDAVSIYPDSRYRWRARAETPDISSAWEVGSFEYTTPAAPTIQDTAYVSGSQLTVNWTDNSAYEDGFRIEVSTDGGAYAEITPGTNTVGANAASYAFAASPDHNYRFKVRSHIGSTPHNGELFSAYSGESSAVYTVSGAPTMGSPVVDSSSSITWHWLDNSAYEEAFHLHFVAGSGVDANDISADSTSYQTGGLLPNTKYQAHVHSYRADTGESEASQDSAAVYTFADTPSDLSLSLPLQNRIRAAWGAGRNPAGTEYDLENMTTGETSGWITSTSYLTPELQCGEEYSFRIKARNHDGGETDYSSPVTIRNSSCGTPLPSGAHNQPTPPPATTDNPSGGFKVVIDEGRDYTRTTVVQLHLFAGADTTRMAISNAPDFRDATLAAFQPTVKWDLAPAGSQTGVSADGVHTVYVKFYTRYGVASQAVSDAITLDTAAPTLLLSDLEASYLTTESVTLHGSTEAGAKVVYDLDGVRAGVIDIPSDGKLTLALGNLSRGVHSLRVVAQDGVGNSSATAQYFWSVVQPSAAPATSQPSAPTLPVSTKPTVPSVPSRPSRPGAISTNTPTPSHANRPGNASNQTTQPGTSVPAIDTPSINSPSTSTPAIDAPAVTQPAPPSLQGDWDLLEVKPIPRAMSSEDIDLIIQKFPELKQTFQNLGITDFKDPSQLQDVSLNLPSLSETMGLGHTDLTALNLPAANTPLAQLSANLKQGIPEDIVFVKTKDANLDVNSSLAFTGGTANQQVSLLAGKSFQLVLKPDQPVKAVSGYITFKSNQVSRADSPSIAEKVAQLFGLHQSALADGEVEEKLVLSQFAYRDDDHDGLWTADISTPSAAGEYEVITVLDYQDVKLGAKTLRLITVVDPEGYVFRQDADGLEARIPDATVSLYVFDAASKRYALWDAKSYQQTNPQTTDSRGAYSFLVPPGTYYLKVEAAGYVSYQGQPFEVRVGSGVHANLELKRRADWRDRLNWQDLLLVVFGAALFCNLYSDRKLRRKLKEKGAT